MNYKQTQITGESWVRASKVLIDNPLEDVASIRFVEENVLNLGLLGKLSTPSINVITERLTKETTNTTFDILDADTLEPTGVVMTYQDVYKLLNSLYMHLAHKRDAQ